MAALYPLVYFLRKRGVPNSLAVSLVYFAVLLFLALLIVPLIPFFGSQVQLLFNSFPKYLDSAAKIFGFQIDPDQFKSLIASDAQALSNNAFTFTTKIFGGFFSLFTIIVVSFYLLLDHDRIRNRIISFFAKSSQSKISSILSRIEEKLGTWLRGQMILSLFIGLIIWVSLTILGIDFALPLGLLAGLLEIAPTIGPVISAIPAVVVAFNISPTMAIIIIVLYTVVQFLESHILVPRIMQKAVGLHPIVIIISVIVGSHLLGVVGALLAVPFVSILTILAPEL